MHNRLAGVVILAAALCLPACGRDTGRPGMGGAGLVPESRAAYFPEGSEYEFGFQFLTTEGSSLGICAGGLPCRFEATYLDRTPYEERLYGGEALRFQIPATGEMLMVTIRGGYAERVRLTPGTTYHLTAQTLPAWPETYGLIIQQGDTLVFQGISDWKLGRTLVIGCLGSVRAEQVRIVTNRYKDRDPCYGRFTNTEVLFSHEGQSVTLHQGQSATLGDFEITLDIARTIDRYFCPDAGLNNISFTVSARGQPAARAPQARDASEVSFPDPMLEQTIRTLVDKPSGPLLASDVARLPCLFRVFPAGWQPDAGGGQIADLTGLESGTNLSAIYLSGAGPSDVTPLAGLTNLRVLHVDHNALVDLSPLAGLTALTDLRIEDNQISDLTPLASLAALKTLSAEHNQIADLLALSGMTSLTRLSLDENQLGDLSPLSGLTGLTELSLDNNQIADASPLAPLVNLTGLWLYWNQIEDISSLSTLVNLTELYLGENQVVDISGLAHLTSLTELDLHDNQIDDISPLVDNAGLGKGDRVNLAGNPLRGETVDRDLRRLEARGVQVFR